MDLLLITGAGASRRLGPEDQPMPLMADWSDALCQALDTAETGLAAACHLLPGMTGEDFEEALGLLIRWQQTRHLEERFEQLGGPQPGHVYEPVREARRFTGERLETVIRVVNSSLYEQFGLPRVDGDRAQAAYERLFAELGAIRSLSVATTNYDRSAEAALVALGQEVRDGFVASPGRTPVLDVRGLVEESDGDTPFLHLHGAVGWYEQGGEVRDHFADREFNPTLGTPVVLYPDPDKDPTSDAVVSAIWTEFEAAVEKASHILVLGHSLHDPALVRAIRRAELTNVGVTVFSDDEVARASQQLPDAVVIQMDFGPDLEFEAGPLRNFIHEP